MPAAIHLDTTVRAEHASNQVMNPKRTLLIVDDEEGPRQSLRIVFKDEYNILLADSGTMAIEMAKQHSVDAAVLDIRMSGMSGVELLGKLKEIDPAIEVIMLTAYETIETARQALRLGACDYLTKPFDISTMRAAIASAMDHHLLSEEIRANNQKLQDLQSELHNQKIQEEIVRTKGEIYASIIHDVTSPLTTIAGYCELIQNSVAHAETLEADQVAMPAPANAPATSEAVMTASPRSPATEWPPPGNNRPRRTIADRGRLVHRASVREVARTRM